jgi:cystathionine gamma-lyase/cystathionine beta-lyase/cystathionine gamma-lyase/homocysteine desulfhydrase
MGLRPHARFSTVCVHGGQTPDPSTGAIITPIFQTSTYVQEELGRHRGYEYARTANPTRSALERNIAELEGGTRALAFASGMAAIHAVTGLLRAGDHVLVTEALYGGTYRLFERVLSRYDLTFSYVDTAYPDLVDRELRPNTRMLFVETPTNPTMRLTDLARMADMARARDLTLVVDSTFSSPFVQRPLALGADIVVHSTTKYLNGHSDSIGGVVVTSRPAIAEALAFLQNAAGAILGPFDSWLVLRGTKTLAVRMTQHNANGLALATWLAAHPKVHQVHYPGLPTHPQHALARQQMNGFGGMLSFDVGSHKAAAQLLKSVRLMSLAESLGGVETLISYPASMTHASVPPEVRARIGITEGLVRISVGIEDIDDLREDLGQALETI